MKKKIVLPQKMLGEPRIPGEAPDDKVFTSIFQNIKEGNQHLDSFFFEGKQVVFILGFTGNGKSTLTNLLVGNKLVIKEQKFGVIGYELEQNEYGAAIGHALESQTALPNIMEGRDPAYIYVDCPGFKDTKGPEQDIPNAFYITKLMEKTKNVKLILTTSNDSFVNKNDSIVSLIKKTTEWFPNPMSIKNGIMLVVTKARAPSSQDCRDKFAEILNTCKSLNEAQKILIQHFSSKQSLITFFREPTRNNPYEKFEDRTSILDGIKKTGSIAELEFQLSISDESKLYIHEVVLEMNRRLKTTIAKLFNDIIKAVRINIKDYKMLYNKSFFTFLQSFPEYLEKLKKSSELESSFGDFEGRLSVLRMASISPSLSEMKELLSSLKSLKQIHINQELQDLQQDQWATHCNSLQISIQDAFNLHEGLIKSDINRQADMFDNLTDLCYQHYERFYNKKEISYEDCVKFQKDVELLESLRDPKIPFSAILYKLANQIGIESSIAKIQEFNSTLMKFDASYERTFRSKFEEKFDRLSKTVLGTVKSKIASTQERFIMLIKDSLSSFAQNFKATSKHDLVSFEKLQKSFGFVNTINNNRIPISPDQLFQSFKSAIENLNDVNPHLQNLLKSFQAFLLLENMSSNGLLVQFLREFQEKFQAVIKANWEKIEQALIQGIISNFKNFLENALILVHGDSGDPLKNKALVFLSRNNMPINDLESFKDYLKELRTIQEEFAAELEITNLDELDSILLQAAKFNLQFSQNSWLQIKDTMKRAVQEITGSLMKEKELLRDYVQDLVREIEIKMQSEIRNRDNLENNIKKLELLVQLMTKLTDFMSEDEEISIQKYASSLETNIQAIKASNIQFNLPPVPELVKNSKVSLDFNISKYFTALKKKIKGTIEWLELIPTILLKLSTDFYSSQEMRNLQFPLARETFHKILEMLGLDTSKLAYDQDRADQLRSLLEATIFDKSEPESSKGAFRITGRCFRISDINKYLQINDSLQILMVFCLNTLHFDAELKAPGVTVVIFAPNWYVYNAVKLDLSGKPCKQQKNYQFQQMQGKNGADGQPGLPGDSGGHFYGFGLKYTCYKGKLIIQANGGAGGDGEDGGDGLAGSDGEDADESNFSSKSKVVSLAEPGQCILNHRDKYLKRKTYVGRPGKPGGNGGKGGSGGFGGDPGIIKLSFQGAVAVSMLAEKGRSGQAGRAGNPGRGGKNGNNYQISYHFKKKTFFKEEKMCDKPKPLSIQVSERAANGTTPSGLNSSQMKNPSKKEDFTSFIECETYLSSLVTRMDDGHLYSKVQKPFLTNAIKDFTDFAKKNWAHSGPKGVTKYNDRIWESRDSSREYSDPKGVPKHNDKSREYSGYSRESRDSSREISDPRGVTNYNEKNRDYSDLRGVTKYNDKSRDYSDLRGATKYNDKSRSIVTITGKIQS